MGVAYLQRSRQEQVMAHDDGGHGESVQTVNTTSKLVA